MTDIKFCGMTRGADAARAASLGAAYVGCIFAGGPRHQTPDSAVRIFTELGQDPQPQRVGVFAAADATALVPVLTTTRLDVIQLHGDPTPAEITVARATFGRLIWAVVRCIGGTLPDGVQGLWDVADAVLLDTHVAGRLGGTGVALPWRVLADQVEASRSSASRRGRLVLAGGLTPENVGEAIRALRPDVVDTSSGVESATGVKDPARMEAFVRAVAAADHAVGRGPEPTRST